MSEHPDPRPRDDTDAVRDMARDLADVASQISTFKGEANAYLSEPGYDDLRLRLEIALAAVEAAAVEARGGGCGSTRAARVAPVSASPAVPARWDLGRAAFTDVGVTGLRGFRKPD